MASVFDIVNDLENIAPPQLADPEDKIGLQAGDMATQVKHVCVVVDVTDRVIETAIERRSDMIVAHHPLIFKPLTSVAQTNPVQRRLIALIKANIALFVMHTNYDAARGGINDVLAEALGVVGSEILTTQATDPFVKVVVFVPAEAVEEVRNAMSDAGAGVIGQYTHCSFRSAGTGSFVPMSAAHPYIGSAGKLEEVDEYRLEMICTASETNDVVDAAVEAHPYDEVAYDIYELANEPVSYGYGRIGSLDEEMTLSAFADRVKAALGLEYIKVAGNVDQKIRRVAVCGGSGSGQYKEAAAAGADVYVTGDTKHHDILDANDLGLSIIDAGHFHTEKPGMVALANRLKRMYENHGIEVDYVE
ncbi:MAG: Nif3-like dinuclear metal center hexameric protein [Armatimonadota bacterium]|jgi:dinuclear metal center YbgI/SA1388 family protein